MKQLSINVNEVKVRTPDQIVFHKGGLIAPTNSLYVEVHTNKANLVTLKELLPDAPDLSQKNDDHWSFNDENELVSTLKEVANLIADKLLDWFENPISNPANIRSNLDHEQQKRMLKENAEGYERDVIRLMAEGKIDEANRFEKAAHAYRDQLSKLE